MNGEGRTRHGLIRAVVKGGLVAGTLDIGAASLINGASPIVILRAVAGGLLGPATFGMGASSAALGLLLQWLMSWLIAAIYALACRRIPSLARHWVRGGLAYGVAIYGVMNFVVFPLSAYRHLPRVDPLHVAGDLLAMFVFGVIVAYFVRPAVDR